MRPTRVGAALALAASGCFPDLNVPAGSNAEIACTTDADCPVARTPADVRVCHNGLCVLPASITASGPDLAQAPNVSPELGTGGTTFNIGLVTRDQVRPPTVSLQMTPATQLTCPGSDSTHYQCQYTASGQENGGLGGQVNFDVELVDQGGNKTTRFSAGHFTLDFTPPSVLGVLIERTDHLASAYTDGGLLLSTSDPYGVLGPGAVPGALISFAVSKPLRDGGVSVFVGDGGATPAPNQAPGFAYTYLYAQTGNEPLGATPVTATMTDIAGNTANGVLGTIIFDRSSPSAGDLTKITYSRNVQEFTYQLRADDGAFQPGSRVRVYTSPSAALSLEVPVSPTGGLSPTPVPGDLPTVYVAQLDAAGNLSSPPADVKRIEWVMGFAGKTSGSGVFNPNAAFYGAGSAPSPDESTTELGGSDYAVLSGAGIDAGAVWQSSTAPLVWARRSIDARALHAMAYDAARARTVVFGGCAGGSADAGACGLNDVFTDSQLNDALAWDGKSWSDLPSTSTPPQRQGHSLADDSVRGRIVLFGGYDALALNPYLNDTWLLDGAQWTQVAPPLAPPGRSGHAMAFDSHRGRVVLFGGASGSGPLNDTWEWDGSTWTQAKPLASPPARSAHAMAFDSNRGRVVIFGGTTGTSILNDTWEWDGSNWTQQTPSAAPSRRSGHAMAFDSTRGRLTLFGGCSDPAGNCSVVLGSTFFGDTWQWDGANWAQATPSTSPGARFAHVMAFDVARGQVVLQGGFTGQADDSATWLWDGTTWTSTAAEPARRKYHALAYDSRRGRTVLFGGCHGVCYGQAGFGTTQVYGDTWEWDGTRWIQPSPTASPPARYQHTMVYDDALGTAVLFGGATASNALLQDMWTWDGTTWTQLSPAASPPPRYEHGMAYDSGRDRIVVTAGSTTYAANGTQTCVNDTWEWDGKTWTQMTSASPPSARCEAPLAYDTGRRRTVMFGGSPWAGFQNIGLQGTHEWDGTAWYQPLPSVDPGGRSEQAVLFDSARGEVTLFGGDCNAGSAGCNSDPWWWDGTIWSTVPVSPLPSTVREGSAAAFDSARGWSVLFGGAGAGLGALRAGTFELGTPAFAALEIEASTFDADTDGAGPTGPTLPYPVVSLAADGLAGGLAAAGYGVVVEVWDETTNAWRSLCVPNSSPCNPVLNTAPASAIAQFRGIIDTSAASLDGVIGGDKIEIRVRPTGVPPTPLAKGTPTLAAGGVRFYLVYQRP